jgi:hypothetical protein
MNPIPSGILDRLAPEGTRLRRRRRRTEQEIDRLVRLNVERMRWELRQSSERALRHFQAELGGALEQALTSVAEIVAHVRALRSQAGEALDQKIADRQAWAGALRTAARAAGVSL